MNVVVLQGFNQHLHRAGNLPLGVGVFHTEKQYAAGLMRHPLGDHALHQIAQMDKTGGGGRHPGADCAFRQFPPGILILNIFRRLRYVGKQKRGKCQIVHNPLPLFSNFSTYYSIEPDKSQFSVAF